MPAQKPIVLLVHGMGGGKPPSQSSKQLGDFGKSFVKAANSSLKAFNRHSGDSIAKLAQIEEFYYNDTFEKIAQAMSDRSQSVKSRFKQLHSLFPDPKGFLPHFIGAYSGWESKFSKDEFFYTHWLDVLFYMTYIGEPIRIKLQKRLADLISQTRDASKIHIVAHSLGTAVVHDALQKLYPPGAQPPQDGDDWFSVEDHQLGSIWMISNVSKLINSITRFPDPTASTSTVKPGPGGCAIRFYNVRHELDPFTFIESFRPRNDGSWVSHETYDLEYRDIATELVLNANTHDFAQYVSDPKVSLPMLSRVIGRSKFRTTKQETIDLRKKHANKSIQGAYARLEQSFESIDRSNLDTIGDFLTVGQEFKTVIEGIKKDLEK